MEPSFELSFDNTAEIDLPLVLTQQLCIVTWLPFGKELVVSAVLKYFYCQAKSSHFCVRSVALRKLECGV